MSGDRLAFLSFRAKSFVVRLCSTIAVALLFSLCVLRAQGQQQPSTSTATSIPLPTPTATPTLFSPQTLGELKQLQQAALNSDYAYKQVAHLANNIGPRLTGSAQAAKAVEYVANELKAIGLEVQLEKVMVPHWVRGEETAAHPMRHHHFFQLHL